MLNATDFDFTAEERRAIAKYTSRHANVLGVTYFSEEDKSDENSPINMALRNLTNRLSAVPMGTTIAQRGGHEYTKTSANSWDYYTTLFSGEKWKSAVGLLDSELAETFADIH